MTEQTHQGTGTTAGVRTSAPPRDRTRPTMWVGWVWFASVMMIMLGIFNVIFGLVALFRDDYYLPVQGGYLLSNAAHDVRPMEIAIDLALEHLKSCLA